MNPPQKTTRLDWIDNLRTAMIFLVVNMHACVTYGHVGDWYFMEKAEPPAPVKILFLFWQGHMQSFFMGLLFFLAGYFAYGSLRKKGAGPFLRERFQRLGIPALLYMLVIHPCTVYFLLGRTWANKPSFAGYYSRYFFEGRIFSGSGPLWFALALLMFCAVYAVLPSRKAEIHDLSGQPPALRSLLLLCGALIFTTFLTRLVQPIGTNILNFQLCFFPQYIIAFAGGIAAAKGGWLQALAESVIARRALWVGLIGGPLVLGTVLFLGGDPGDQQPPSYAGGWNWQAFGLAAWEQSAGPCLALGLMSLFQKRFSLTTPLLKWLSDRSFAVYVLHAPVLIALAMAAKDVPLNPLIKTLILTVVGLVCAYVIGDAAKRVPGLRQCL